MALTKHLTFSKVMGTLTILYGNENRVRKNDSINKTHASEKKTVLRMTANFSAQERDELQIFCL
jgi:hypothetical protein